MAIIPLDVPFREKDQAKSLGAKWDVVNKHWYIHDDMEVALFDKWLPDGIPVPQKTNDFEEIVGIEKGISLTEYLSTISQAVKKVASNLVWIRAELSDLKIKSNGHYRMYLVDSSSNGRQISKCSATIWSDKAAKIASEFKKQTDSELQDGMKILLQGRADLHPLYGLSIHINDIDSSYTLGNLLANLKALRKKLQDEQLYEKNKQIPKPKDFTKVAVISPDKAAGLGDFKKEADLLHQYGLCEFTYYNAIFQGKTAGELISNQILKVLDDNTKNHYDLLVIIRGGGAVADLAWLNDYDIARAICNAAIPVFSGIGHEKDNTIIDEVSCCKFDTPSKVIKHIWGTIKDNAGNAEKNIKIIFDKATFVIANNRKSLDSVFTACMREAANKIKIQEKGLDSLFSNVLQFAHHSVRLINQHVNSQFKDIIGNSSNASTVISSKLSTIYHDRIIHLMNSLVIDYKQKLVNSSAKIFDRSYNITIVLKDRLNTVYNEKILRSLVSLVNEYKQKLLNNAVIIFERGKNATEKSNNFLIGAMKIIEITNPINILKRGFVLVRSKSNSIVTSKVKALESFQTDQELKLVFSDGDMVVTDIKQDTQ